MSQISKALQKVQKSREYSQDPQIGDIVYLSDVPRIWPKTVLMVFLVIGTTAAVFMSIMAIRLAMVNAESRQTQMAGLDKAIKMQERQINDLTALLDRKDTMLKEQIRGLNYSYRTEARVMQAQIRNLSSEGRGNYGNLKEAILDDKQEIQSLDDYARQLDQKIETISVKLNQAGEAQPSEGISVLNQ